METTIEPGAVPDETTTRLLADAFFTDKAARRMIIAQLKSRRTILEFLVRGSSMSGSLPSGCRIRIACEAGLPAPGAVIAVLIGKFVVRVHRVVWRGRRGAARGWVITRGGSLTAPDIPHDVSFVLGRVTEIEIDGAWRAVPDAPRRRWPRVSDGLDLLIAAALEIDPRLAQIAADLLRRLQLLYRRLLSWSALPRRVA